jgi:hypothetical protein
VDVYEPSSGPQINDMNPGITPSGLFWTMAIPGESVHVEFDDEDTEDAAEEASAVMQARDVSVTDFHDFNNSLFGGGPKPVPATLSFAVRWLGGKERVKITNLAQGFAGTFIRNQAPKWSGLQLSETLSLSPLQRARPRAYLLKLGTCVTELSFADWRENP